MRIVTWDINIRQCVNNRICTATLAFPPSKESTKCHKSNTAAASFIPRKDFLSTNSIKDLHHNIASHTISRVLFRKHSVPTVTKHIMMRCELPNTLNGTN